MYAIVQTGGKQYRVEPGDRLKVEKIPGDPGTSVDLNTVLAVGGADELKVGDPLLADITVKATIVRTARDRKIVVFKKKRRQGYHKKQGHRQWFTLLRIDSIESGVVPSTAPQSEPEPEPEVQTVAQQPEPSAEPESQAQTDATETASTEEKSEE